MLRNSAGKEAPPLFGLVLAGGRSRRFGRDKAGIEIDGQTLLDRVVALFDGVCERVFVSVRDDQIDEALRKSYALIVDQQPEYGPAGGLLAAQAHAPEAAWLVTACDMPLLDRASIRLLIDMRRAEKAATGYRSPVGNLPEPLCAIWEPATLEKFRQRVESGGSLSPRDMLAETDVELIDATDARVLTNINTLLDFDRLGLGESGN
jgi:molybdopterin-guanine dinucleotide biosynthesis protein A